MKTIIAGTDFTPSSINACKYAAFLAQKLNCKLTVFNMFEAPVIHSNVGLYGISYSSQKTESVKRTSKVIKQLQELFPKIKIEQFVANKGFKYELENFTSMHQIEAAVMGLAAKNRISKFIYGSHGVDIAGKIDCPVIIVPEKYKVHKLAKVLLAVDNNEKLRKSSLNVFENFIKESKTKLTVLHVRTEDEIFDPVIDKLVINTKKFPIEIIPAKDIQDGVKKYCVTGNIDLVTIISKTHSVFYNLFTESNAKKVAYVAKVPVMTMHE